MQIFEFSNERLQEQFPSAMFAVDKENKFFPLLN
jgi:hypothetical protein